MESVIGQKYSVVPRSQGRIALQEVCATVTWDADVKEKEVLEVTFGSLSMTVQR